MATYTTSVGEWIDPLRKFTLGMSIASLFLVPPAAPYISLTKIQPTEESIELVTTIPDGTVDLQNLRTVHFRTPRGLETLLQQPILQTANRIETDYIPQTLRDITGLPVETLASLAKVSRNAYYKWLDGRGVTSEHRARLIELLDTFRTLHNLQGANLKEFLEDTGPIGRPIDLLAAGNSSAVIGLALRSSSKPIDAYHVSDTARQISGLSGWLHPAAKFHWDGIRLTNNEREEALDRLSPMSLLPYEEKLLHDVDESDEVFAAWGFVLE